MKNCVKILFVCFFGSIILSSFIQNNKMKMNINENIDFVPNEETAIKVAEAIWYPIYGESIYQKKPFKAELKNEVWIIKGSLPSGMKGGVPYIEIQKKDCKILKVTHGK